MPLTTKRIHSSLIDSKAESVVGNPAKKLLLEACKERYLRYESAFRGARSRGEYQVMADTLDAYLSYAKNLESQEKELLGPRTKYYSSILEEMPVLLSVDTVERLTASSERLTSKILLLGDSECTVRIGANPDGSRFCETKRIDFCLAVFSPDLATHVPLVGFEVKKYMDKTMFGTVLETYKALQIFRPRTHYGFLVEDEARDSSVILNSPLYGKEFILTDKRRDGSERNRIDAAVLERFHLHLQAAMEEAFRALIPEIPVS